MSHRLASVTTLAVLALAAAARGGIDVEVGNTDTIAGTISPATETEVIRFRLPAGASVTVKAKAAKKGPELHLVLRDPTGAELRTADGKAAAIAGAVAGVSGVFSAEVTSRNGTAKGDYSVTVSWKTVPSATVTATLATDGVSTLDFSADAGATATLSVKPAKGSSAAGGLVSLTSPDASVAPLTGSAAKRTIAASGDYTLSFKNSATAGDLTATVKLKPPKPSKRKIALTSKVIDPGGQISDFATAGLLGASGGTVAVPAVLPNEPGAAIAGTSVTVPAGALGTPTTIIVATAPPLEVPSGGTGAGPTAFFGPEGTQFGKSTAATITLPYDPAFDTATDTLQIYTRNAKGKVTVVPPPYTFDHAAHTVTFPTSHFSSFRAVGPGGSGSAVILTYANVTDPEDVSFANEPGTPTNPAFLFVAEGTGKTVAALRQSIAPPSAILTRETWVGGGTQSNDGTPRLQFKFPSAPVSIYSTSNQELFVATATQIFRVGTDEKVSLYAGTGTSSDTGDNGLATAATFVSIASITVDDNGDNSLYVADSGAHRIRRIDSTSNTIFAWAGSGQSGVGADGVALDQTTFLGPSDISVVLAPGRGLWVADGARVRQLAPDIISISPLVNFTVAGSATGQTGSGGDDGPALQATFQNLSAVTTYVDVNDFAAVKLVVSDSTDQTLRLIDVTNDKVTLLAGQHGVAGFSGDFSTFPGLLDGPRGVFTFPGQAIFADTNNGKIRTRIIGGP